MNKKSKSALCIIAAAALCLSVGATAYADGTSSGAEETSQTVTAEGLPNGITITGTSSENVSYTNNTLTVKGGTITLTEDVTCNIIVSGENVVLNLGSYTLSNSGSTATVTVNSNGSLTINGGTGTVENTYASGSGRAVFNNGGKVTIDGGTYKRDDSSQTKALAHVIYNNGTSAVMTINNAVIFNYNTGENGRSSATVVRNNTGTMTVTKSTVSGDFSAVKNDETGTLEISESVINVGVSENSAWLGGSGVQNFGTAIISDTTINTAGPDSLAIWALYYKNYDSSTNVNSCKITGDVWAATEAANSTGIADITLTIDENTTIDGDVGIGTKTELRGESADNPLTYSYADVTINGTVTGTVTATTDSKLTIGETAVIESLVVDKESEAEINGTVSSVTVNDENSSVTVKESASVGNVSGNVSSNAEFQIGENTYYTYNDLKNALADGDEVTVAKLSEAYTISTDKHITVKNNSDNTITVNGHEISSSDGTYTVHILKKADGTDPTCSEDGNIEYYVCEFDNKYFSDENGEKEIALSSTVISKTGEHESDGIWHFDSEGHWNICTSGGEKLNYAPHTPSTPENDEDAVICIDCGYVITPAKDHVHTADLSKWDYDENTHWHNCTGNDGERLDEDTHNYVDGVCTVCGAEDPDYSSPVPDTPAAPAVATYAISTQSSNVQVSTNKAAAGEKVDVKVPLGYVAYIYSGSGELIAVAGSNGGSFIMPNSSVTVAVRYDETYIILSSAAPRSYIFSYDSDMNQITVNATKNGSKEITVKLGSKYAGKTAVLYSGKKNTSVKLETVVLDKNGNAVFQVEGGKNYTLVVE